MSKSNLNLYCQKSRIPTPAYSTTKNGEDLFCSTVTVNEESYVSVQGHSTKKEAENDAAEVALQSLVQRHPKAKSAEDLIKIVDSVMSPKQKKFLAAQNLPPNQTKKSPTAHPQHQVAPHAPPPSQHQQQVDTTSASSISPPPPTPANPPPLRPPLVGMATTATTATTGGLESLNYGPPMVHSASAVHSAPFGHAPLAPGSSVSLSWAPPPRGMLAHVPVQYPVASVPPGFPARPGKHPPIPSEPLPPHPLFSDPNLAYGVGSSPYLIGDPMQMATEGKVPSPWMVSGAEPGEFVATVDRNA